MNYRLLSGSIMKNRTASAAVGMCCVVSAFLIVALSVFALALDASFDEAYAKMSGPRCIYTSDDRESLEKIISLPAVVETKADYALFERFIIKGVTIGSREFPFVWFCMGDGTDKISDGEVWINNTISSLKRGDSVTVRGKGEALLTGKLIDDPINAAPSVMSMVLYVNPRLFEMLKADGIKPENVLYLYDKEKTPEIVLEKYRACYGESFRGEIRSYEDIRNDYLFAYRLTGRYLKPVSAMVLIFTAFLDLLLVNMILTSDKKEIGILRSLGLSLKKEILIYVAQLSAFALAGGGIGAAAGMAMLKLWLGNMFAGFENADFHIYRMAFWALSTALTVTFFQAASTAVIAYASSADMHRVFGGFLKKRHLRLRIVCLKPFENKLKPNRIFLKILGFFYGIKRPAQTAAIASTVVFIGGLLLFTVLLCDGILNRNTHLTEWGMVSLDIYVSRINNVDEEENGLLKYLAESPDVDYAYAALSDTVFYNKESVSGRVTADIYDKNILPQMEDCVTDGRLPKNTGELAVGINFARKNNVSIGDIIEITHGESSRRMSVTGIYFSYKEYGDTIMYAVDDIIGYFGNSADGYYSIVLKEGADAEAVRAELGAHFADYRFVPMKRGLKDIMLNMLIPLVLMLLLCLGVLTALLRVLLKMCISDNRDDLAAYTCIGAAKSDIRTIIRYSFFPTVTASIFIAALHAVFLLPRIFDQAAQELGLLRVPIYPSFFTLSFGTAMIMLSAAIVFENTQMN